MASYVGQVKIGSNDLPVAATLYGTCTTAETTVEKTVVCANFDKLITGVLIFVNFTKQNLATNPTLNVNGTGAKPIKVDSSTAVGSTMRGWAANAMTGFVYDGNNWIMIAPNYYYANTVYVGAPSSSNYNYPVIYCPTLNTTDALPDSSLGRSNSLKFNPSTGNLTVGGKLTVGASPTNSMDVATKGYVTGLFSLSGTTLTITTT